MVLRTLILTLRVWHRARLCNCGGDAPSLFAKKTSRADTILARITKYGILMLHSHFYECIMRLLTAKI